MRRTAGRVYRRGKTWWIDYQVEGKRFRHALKDHDGNAVTSADDARAELDRLTRPYTAKTERDRRQLAADALRTSLEVARAADDAARVRIPLADAWTAYLADQARPQSGEATLEQYGFQWQAFAKWMGQNRPDAKAFAEVTSEHAESYIASIKTTLARGTVLKHVRLCRLVFRVLGEREQLPHGNPFARIKTGGKGTGGRGRGVNRREELRQETLWKVFEAADGELRRLLFVGLYTGQRLADCCLLTWEQIDMGTEAEAWISFTPRKTSEAGTEVIIPMVSHLRNELDRTPANARTGYVCPELAKHYTANRDRVTDRIQALLRRCGVEVYADGTGPGTGKRAVLRYGFHSLRHSTATILQELGTPAAVAEAILGHRSEAMRRHYTHIGRKALQDAMHQMPAPTRPETLALPAATDAACNELIQQITPLLPQATEAQLRAILATLKG